MSITLNLKTVIFHHVIAKWPWVIVK